MPYDSKLGPIPDEHFEKDHVYDESKMKAQISPKGQADFDKMMDQNVEAARKLREGQADKDAA